MISSKRSLLALLIVVGWALSMAWLGIRRGTRSESALLQSEASLRLSDSEAWFRVMAGEIQIGTAGVTLDTLGSRYRIREALTLHLPRAEALQRSIRQSDYYLNPSLGIDSVISSLSTSGRRSVTRITASGGGWEMEFGSGESRTLGRLVDTAVTGLAGAPVPVRVLPFRLALVGALASGQPRTLTTTDGWPPSGTRTEVIPRGDTTLIFPDSSEVDLVTGDWVPATYDTVEARSVVIQGVSGPLRLRVDHRGTLVGLETALGMRWEREEFSIARFNFRRNLDSTEQRLRTALPQVSQLTELPGALAPVTYRVTRRDGSRIPGVLFVLLATPRQRIVPGSNQLTVGGEGPRQPLPLVADPLIQINDSTVIRFADELDNSSNWDAVIRHVSERVSVDTALGAAIDAAGALSSGRARPEGMARLAAAVLRRRGLIANVAIGVMPANDTLFTHAWVEIADRFRNYRLAMDPVSGMEVSERLLQVAAAGSSHPEELMPLILDARITEVPSSSPPEE